MSWDEYNKARKKAKKIADGKISKSDAKTAVKNAKKHRWALYLFLFISIVALATLPFASYFESLINSTFEREGIVAAITEVQEESNFSVTYVDVMQGDCILINLPDGKNMIIDAGSSFSDNRDHGTEIWTTKIKPQIDNHLTDITNRKIDYLIMTHPDFDHFSYMDEILENYDVLEIYRPCVFYGTEEGETNAKKLEIASEEETRAENAGLDYVTEEEYKANKDLYDGFNVKVESASSYGDILDQIYEETSNVKFSKEKTTIKGSDSQGNEYKFTFWAPLENPSYCYTDWNNYSSFITLQYKEIGYCFTGDTEQELEEQIIEKYGSELPDIDIMDAGHHGSKTSSSSALLNLLKPEVVICSCGTDNEYGHPHPEAINRFISAGVAQNCIFTTSNNGTITVALDYALPIVDTEGDGAAALSEEEQVNYSVGVTKFGSVEVTNTKWWQVVVGIIVAAGVILLILVPSLIKKKK